MNKSLIIYQKKKIRKVITLYHGNEVMSEKYIAWSHIPVNNGTSTAFLMQKTQSFCGSNGNGISLAPLKNFCIFICKKCDSPLYKNLNPYVVIDDTKIFKKYKR